MSAAGVCLGYLLIGLAFLLLSPLIVLIALADWCRCWCHGRAPRPFVPEHPDSQRRWIERMERARRLQAQEEDRR